MNPQDPFQQPTYMPPTEPTQPLQPLQASPNQPYEPVTPPAQAPVAQSAPYGPAPAKSSKKWAILTFVFIFTTLAAIGFAVWAYMSYVEQKTNVETKVNDAVSLAVKKQQEKDADAFAEMQKNPNTLFAGPEDYGQLSFNYPKTWGVYEVSDASSGGTYKAVFSLGVIPPYSTSQRYALRVTISSDDYEDIVSGYQSKVKSGDLTSSTVTINDQSGTRLDGSFSKDVRGSAIIIKIRDKTAVIQTDAETFTNDFNTLVKTITFNK